MSLRCNSFRMIAGLFNFPGSLDGRNPIRSACASRGPPSRFPSSLPPIAAPPSVGPEQDYEMADFAQGAFAAYFMQCPSFLAHQRHLETGQGQSNHQTFFGM